MMLTPRKAEAGPNWAVPLTWTCVCGGKSYAHHTYCAACGNPRRPAKPTPRAKRAALGLANTLEAVAVR